MDPIILNVQVGERIYPFPLQGYESLSALASGAMMQHAAEFDKGKLRMESHAKYLPDLVVFWADANDIVKTRRDRPIRLDHIESLALLATAQFTQVELSVRESTPLDPTIQRDLELFSQVADRFAQEAYSAQAERKA